MSDKAKVVVLGTDHPHVFAMAKQAAQLDGAELAGFYAADEAQQREAAEKLEVPSFASVDEALRVGPKLALIGAVPNQRAALAERALDAGAAVLADKPLVLNMEALERLKAAVVRSGKPVSVYYPYRGNGLTLAAKKLIDSGKIGDVVRVFASGPHKLNPDTRPDWHWTRAGNGGALIDLGSHHADFCCWIAGEAPSWLCAVHENYPQPQHPEFQDFAQSIMRFPSGKMAHVEVDWLNTQSLNSFGDTRFWIQGTSGKIEIRPHHGGHSEWWTDELAAQPLDPAPEAETWNHRLIEELVRGESTIIPQEEVWRTSEVTLQAFESAQQGGRPIELAAQA